MSGTISHLNASIRATGLDSASPQGLVISRDTLNQTLDQTSTDTPAASTNQETRATISEQGKALSAADQREVERLRQIDTAVRAHEQAHIRAGRGVITSGPNYTYTYGPDGRQYAIAGEVGIDTAPEREPRANIDKGQRIQDAALAPAQPSSQDYSVAAVGSQLEGQGRIDLAQELRDELIARREAAAEAAQENTARAEEADAASNEQTAASESTSAPPPAQNRPSEGQTTNVVVRDDGLYSRQPKAESVKEKFDTNTTI